MGYVSNIRKKIGHDAMFMPAAACIIIKDNEMLLQKRADNGKWAIHGGGLELGETFLQGLERELREELNIKPLDPKIFDVYSGEDLHLIYPNKDEAYMVTAIYTVTKYEGKPKPDNDEVLEVKWFNIDNLPDNIHEPDIRPINDIKEMLKK